MRSQYFCLFLFWQVSVEIVPPKSKGLASNALCYAQTAPATMDVEAATAAVEAELDAQEWNMAEIERAQEAQVNCRAPFLWNDRFLNPITAASP